MNEYQLASHAYGDEVQRVAAELVERGECAPWTAITRAHDIVQERRQRRARSIDRGATKAHEGAVR